MALPYQSLSLLHITEPAGFPNLSKITRTMNFHTLLTMELAGGGAGIFNLQSPWSICHWICLGISFLTTLLKSEFFCSSKWSKQFWILEYVWNSHHNSNYLPIPNQLNSFLCLRHLIIPIRILRMHCNHENLANECVDNWYAGSLSLMSNLLDFKVNTNTSNALILLERNCLLNRHNI